MVNLEKIIIEIDLRIIELHEEVRYLAQNKYNNSKTIPWYDPEEIVNLKRKIKELSEIKKKVIFLVDNI